MGEPYYGEHVCTNECNFICETIYKAEVTNRLRNEVKLWKDEAASSLLEKSMMRRVAVQLQAQLDAAKGLLENFISVSYCQICNTELVERGHDRTCELVKFLAPNPAGGKEDELKRCKHGLHIYCEKCADQARQEKLLDMKPIGPIYWMPDEQPEWIEKVREIAVKKMSLSGNSHLRNLAEEILALIPPASPDLGTRS